MTNTRATVILNKAYIPILQGMSPGELQSAENALNFAKILVTDWLARYKFKNWATHSSTGAPVTDADKTTRAKEIADQLCDHRHWLPHGRSIKLDDLKKMQLAIVDYSQDAKLLDAISRYFALLQMTFATNIYKIYETPDSQILKALAAVVPQQLGPQQMQSANGILLDFVYNSCKTLSKIQANLGVPQPLQPGNFTFPPNNKFKCPKCGVEHDLTDTRRQIEAQAKKRVV